MLLTGNNSGVLDQQIMYDTSQHQRRGQQSVLSSDTTSMGTKGAASGNGDGGEATASGDSEQQQQQITRRDALKKWYAEYCGACEADQRALWEGKKMRQVEISPFIG